MSNPRSSLVEAFNRDYVEDMAADRQQASNLTSAEQTLEQIEAFLTVGWDANATHYITEFERRYGIDFAELCEGTPIEDPR